MANLMALARVDALIARVQRASRAVAAAKNDRLHQRIGLSLTKRLADRLIDLKKRRPAIASDQSSAQDISLVTAEYDQLFGECLMYVEAGRSRATDVDADLCEITDLLFQEIAERLGTLRWKYFSAFAPDDSYDPSTDIIRIRYPLNDVWDIPIAVHEFGHFLSRRILGKRADASTFLPLETQKAIVAQEKQQEPQAAAGTEWPVYMDELFADILATYTLGPAFAFSAVLLRFDPSRSTVQQDGRHPPDAARTFAILETLRRLQDAKALAGPIGVVESFWKEACAASRTDPRPSAADRSWLAAQVSTACGALNAAETILQYSGWQRAKGLVPALQAATPPAPQPVLIADALNAAWMLRFKPGIDPTLIHRNVVALLSDQRAKYV